MAAVCAAALLGGPPPAAAHGGDSLARPVLEGFSPDVEGLDEVDAQVVYSANFQFLVENPTGEELVVFADEVDPGTGKVVGVGEPFIRIGPAGTFGNFKSKAWYASNVPEGLQQFPDVAESGAGVEPAWRKVAIEPSWGWYDHRLHPVERFVNEEVREAGETKVLGRFAVPIGFGGERAEMRGRFEYQPNLGTYRSRITSAAEPAPGVRVQVVSSRTVPAMFVENRSAEPIVFLGRDGEPFARIGPKAEVNLKSPLWSEILQARGQTPTATADAGAAPAWAIQQDTPLWSWIEPRAAPPPGEPSEEVTGKDSPTTVKTWQVPYRMGDTEGEVAGVTEFVPIASLREPADEGASKLVLYAGIGVATVGVGWYLRRPRPRPAPTGTRARSTVKRR